jgi:hypothetical protein
MIPGAGMATSGVSTIGAGIAKGLYKGVKGTIKTAIVGGKALKSATQIAHSLGKKGLQLAKQAKLSTDKIR